MPKNNTSNINTNNSGIVFPGIAGVIDVQDNSRKELILVEIPGAPNPNAFSNLYIMNFDSSDKSDYMINKDISNSFVFTAFGHSVTTIVLSGYQSAGIDQLASNAKKVAKSKPTEDAEYIYRQHCISGPDPRLVKITTGVSDIVQKGSVYRGYMVAFNKKPMGEDKLQGYAFGITLICEREGEVTEDNKK